MKKHFTSYKVNVKGIVPIIELDLEAFTARKSSNGIIHNVVYRERETVLDEGCRMSMNKSIALFGNRCCFSLFQMFPWRSDVLLWRQQPLSRPQCNQLDAHALVVFYPLICWWYLFVFLIKGERGQWASWNYYEVSKMQINREGSHFRRQTQ